ncbi:alpha/beta hydrolase [Dysgonomonas sp. HDW5A]|uniref:alpha/beta fold hydrolase n=1 Tax=Dysgonomonas sp. HDW5A TaxID=2714926 RepID=UPI00140CBBE0|nr:alpha/beta hydrolase [Dysgonomonas sp. HDW5A]QIK58315.1 alpha/beta hydrolase [Dysgonomonas sp. HDW5A]
MTHKLFYNDSNHSLAYTDFGNKDGIPLIVQHGMIASIKDEYLFGNHLKESARIICVARPGYGESSPFVMDSYLEWGHIISILANDLSLETFDIFSSSAGAPYGYAIGKVCSDKVRNMYIFSGTPALYDEEVQSGWPYPIVTNLSVEDSRKIAYDIFFADIPYELSNNDDIKDSKNNNCFGVGQDLRIRFRDWGFTLSDIKAKVFMQHSKKDEVQPYKTAIRTSQLLPDCTLELLENGVHFSVESFQSFIEKTIIKQINY